MSDSSLPTCENGPCLIDGQELLVDGHAFHIRVSARRSRLGLTIERDGSITLRVPQACSEERATSFARKHRDWIDDKLRLRAEHRPLNPIRELANGEIFRYLGRDYLLFLTDEPEQDEPGQPVRLVAGRLQMDRSTAADPRRGRRAIANWYSKAGLQWAEGRLQPWAARMDIPEPEIDIRDLGRRWGTYRPEVGASGQIALHWAVFQLPAHLIDYVIAHELAHVRIAGHGPDYWRLLRRAMPECEQWKADLDELGRRLWLGEVAKRSG
ncbi:SprT family zinc-dependent metalloprotease [Nocardiopsis rhodophaea]|uniref:M48 family metallopeptidase n=1 Tax=Nocardiopsis rhodophaea TaxID=280238 RepID=UPI0031CFEF76